MHIDVISAPLDVFWPGVFAMGLGGLIRPPKEIPGLVDWRLGGKLSEMILEGKLTGESGESTMVWSEKRQSKVYIIGLGKRMPLSGDIARNMATLLVKRLILAREKRVLLLPNPILHGPGGKGAEGAFLEGVLAAIKETGRDCSNYHLIIPEVEKEASKIHEGFRKAILRVGMDAEGIHLSMIDSHLALQH